MAQAVPITTRLRASISVDIDTDARSAVLAVFDYSDEHSPRLLADHTLLTQHEHSSAGIALDDLIAAADAALNMGRFIRTGSWTIGVDYLGMYWQTAVLGPQSEA